MASESKDLKTFFKNLDEIDPETPAIFLVSGTDTAVFDQALSRIKKNLKKATGFEMTLFSGEPGDEQKMREEIFNIPLFAPFRLIAIREAQEIFKQITASSKTAKALTAEFEKLPDRTLIVMEYKGNPPAKFTGIFGPRLHHFKSRELYSNQVMDAIVSGCKKLGLKLTDQALNEFKEKTEPKSGVIGQALIRLKEMTAGKETITEQDVQEILFPNPGYNAFAFIDALYSQDYRTVLRELNKFNPATDSYFGAMKLMLMRADEIRKARAGKAAHMNDEEMIKLLKLKGRPPFIQKKILRRLDFETSRISRGRLKAIYRLLIDLQIEFKSRVSASNQGKVFSERIIEVFF